MMEWRTWGDFFFFRREKRKKKKKNEGERRVCVFFSVFLLRDLVLALFFSSSSLWPFFVFVFRLPSCANKRLSLPFLARWTMKQGLTRATTAGLGRERMKKQPKSRRHCLRFFRWASRGWPVDGFSLPRWLAVFFVLRFFFLVIAPLASLFLFDFFFFSQTLPLKLSFFPLLDSPAR